MIAGKKRTLEREKAWCPGSEEYVVVVCGRRGSGG